jgi:hypothetical protein
MTEIENQIAELLLSLSIEERSREQIDQMIAARFPAATEQEIAEGGRIAIEILQAAAEAYEAEAEPYKAEIAKRRLL